MTPVSQAEIDAATGKAPAVTMTPVSQAELDAAAGRAPAPTTAPAPASGGGAFDAPPPSVELPHGATTTAGASAATDGPDAEGTGTRAPDDALSARPKPATPSLQDQADKALASSEQADADAVAAKQARDEAWQTAQRANADNSDPANTPAATQAYGKAADALDAAKDNAAAAHEKAMDAANAAKAATDPLGAAADAAARDLADAQKLENKAFFGKDAQAYHDARAALDAAQAKADAAQAAADAAKNGGGSGTIPSHKKP